MTNAQMKTEVLRMLGNMQSSDPFYADVQTWVNRGVQDVVLMGVQGLQRGIDLFPELRATWTSDLTVNGVNKQALPADKLLITWVGSFDKKAAINFSTDRALPMNYVSPRVFETIVKDSTRTGWPRIWTMEGRDIKYHPTPSSSPTDYTTYLLYIGVQRDPYPDMSADADTPIISTIWHDACVTRAAAIGAKRKGWFDRADAWDAEVKMRLGLSTDIGALEDAAQKNTIEIAGVVTREDLYGGA